MRHLCSGLLLAASATWTVISAAETKASPQSPAITVPAGQPLHVVLEQRVSYTKTGRPIYGHITQPVYVFDQVAIPAGTEVVGKIAEVHPVPRFRQFNSVVGGDFTRLKEAQVEFDSLVMKDGSEVAIRSVGAMRDSSVVRMASSAQHKSLWRQLKDTVRGAVSSQKQSIEDMVRAPNKMERLKNGFLARLPIHPQVFEPGTQFVTELQAPLQVRAESNSPSAGVPASLDQLVTRPPADTILHARLNATLSSAKNRQGDQVEAILSEPVFSADHHLLFPEGTRLLGVVLKATPAKRLGRSGNLRFTFKEVELPSGIKNVMHGELAAVDAGKGDNVQIDEEGGTRASEPKLKYLVPLAVVLLAQSAGADDHDAANGSVDPVNGGVAAGGFGIVGRLLAISAGSKYVAYGIGYYGASRSIYSRFIGRGRDVVFPKDTRLDIKVGNR